jgi:hypothetical protein
MPGAVPKAPVGGEDPRMIVAAVICILILVRLLARDALPPIPAAEQPTLASE